MAGVAGWPGVAVTVHGVLVLHQGMQAGASSLGTGSWEQGQWTLDMQLQEKGKRQGVADRVHALGCRKALWAGAAGRGQVFASTGL